MSQHTMPRAKQLREAVRDAVPHVTIEVDPPGAPDGRWFMDVDDAGHRVVIEWIGDGPIGVSSSEEPGYGEGPEESYADVEQAAQRVVELLRHRLRTVPPAPCC